MKVLVVWRDKEGATLSTYAKDGTRTPYVEDVELNEDNEMLFVNSDELRTLVSKRDVFKPVFVAPKDAELVLGWKAE